MNYNHNIPKVIVGQDGMTLYSVNYLYQGCTFEIVPIGYVQQYQQLPVYPGNMHCYNSPQQNAAMTPIQPTAVVSTDVVDYTEEAIRPINDVRADMDDWTEKHIRQVHGGASRNQRSNERRSKKGDARVADRKEAQTVRDRVAPKKQQFKGTWSKKGAEQVADRKEAELTVPVADRKEAEPTDQVADRKEAEPTVPVGESD